MELGRERSDREAPVGAAAIRRSRKLVHIVANGLQLLSQGIELVNQLGIDAGARRCHDMARSTSPEIVGDGELGSGGLLSNVRNLRSGKAEVVPMLTFFVSEFGGSGHDVGSILTQLLSRKARACPWPGGWRE